MWLHQIPKLLKLRMEIGRCWIKVPTMQEYLNQNPPPPCKRLGMAIHTYNPNTGVVRGCQELRATQMTIVRWVGKQTRLYNELHGEAK